ncbi:hypothetical protein BD410DRAFT_461654 [Rickenella mellea]|uniref:Sacsin/Nov domain-containing protein n=1 Tax=Rickenella mellea TaxID=50990 RepID=A0A4Y7PUX3_9AGAM|nr:hypothetical protein BD410DRAFT_461654 [Rickenella mellea]
MPKRVREHIAITTVIKGILDHYPAGAATLREFLQNTDDCGATTQNFVLDTRSFSTTSVFHPVLEACQGPALFATNDGLFKAADWKAITEINTSSKTGDETTTGKFGLGFRSCYHITDTPQIFSGHQLLTLDPHGRVPGYEGGFELNTSIESDLEKYSDHFDAFAAVLPEDEDLAEYDGTAIRLPLRLEPQALTSEIKQMPTSIADIRRMFEDFASKELPVAMLFLKNITSISLSEVDEEGAEKVFARAWIEMDESDIQLRSQNRGREQEMSPLELFIHLEINGAEAVQQWLVWHFVESYETIQEIMAEELEQPISQIRTKMVTDKLLPHIALAIALPSLSWLPYTPAEGKLFTLLPLPIDTGFPLHLHGILALTSSRQGLRNYHDVAVGSREEFLVMWNQIVFSHLAPKAWAGLLVYLADQSGLLTPFDLWPNLSSFSGGDQHYWEGLPRRLLECTASEHIWPVSGGNVEDILYLPLEDLLIVEPTDFDERLIQTLKLCGILVTHPPKRVFSLITESDELSSFIMTPATVRAGLNNRVDDIRQLGKNSLRILCDYLASASDLSLLLGLPLIPTVDGRHISISLRETFPHILATPDEAIIFGNSEPDLLSQQDMAPETEALLLKTNRVHCLLPARVLTYLQNRFPQRRTSNVALTDADIRWLIQFWTWIGRWNRASDLLSSPLASKLHILHLIPLSTGNEARRCASFAIGFAEGSSDLIEAFKTLKLPVLHPEVSAQNPVIRHMMKLPNSVAFLLDELAHHTNYFPAMDVRTRELIHDHLTTCFASGRPSLTDAQKNTLRLLPIFPLIPPGERQSGNITFDNAPVSSKFIDSSIEILPSVHGIAFVDAVAGHGLLAALCCKVIPEPLLLEIAIFHWSQQDRWLASLLIHRIMRRMSDLSLKARLKLQNLPFITVSENETELRAPALVVDPRSRIALLFDSDDLVLPTGDFGLNEPGSYMSVLRDFGMLLYTLTPEIIMERVDAIANPSKIVKERSMKAFTLLELLDELCRGSRGVPSDIIDHITSRKWLPASGGLHVASDCWDNSHADTPFCDSVLNIIDLKLSSNELRQALGWDEISFHTLLRQLVNIVAGKARKTPSVAGNDSKSQRIVPVLLELGRRYQAGSVDDDDLDYLLECVGNQPWVPTTSMTCMCAEQTMLCSTYLGPAFQRVYPNLLDDETTALLKRMGISERPPLPSLRAELHSMSSKTYSDSRSKASHVKTALAILEEICSASEVSPDFDPTDLFIPITDSTLHRAKSVLYNDTGLETEATEGSLTAHPDLSQALARKLRLTHLSSENFHRDGAGFEVFCLFEDLTTRINGVLMAYHVEYASNEWIANADDANASQVSLLVDERIFHGPRLLAPSMTEFQECPALVIHNDSIFTKEDFSGLARIGVGGKGDLPDKIGRFGLGVLSLYHFTELPMIVSADCVLFLDPSRKYLPHDKGPQQQRLNGVKMTLESCRIRYPDHMKPLDGLFQFSITQTHYNGTIFRLPLRTASQAKDSKISEKSFSAVDIHSIDSAFYPHATQSLFFSKIRCIQALRRGPGGRLSQLWRVTGQRDLSEAGLLSSTKLQLQFESGMETTEEKWLVTCSTREEVVPAQFAPLIKKYRLSTPSLAIALPLSIPPDVNAPKLRLFATLPLPIETSLPVHLHSSWILSSDRRSIQYDAPDASGAKPLDSLYNEYLLTELCPPVYFETLAAIVTTHPNLAYRFWPTETIDNISAALAKSFYANFTSTPHSICKTVTNLWKAPPDCWFNTSKNPAVRDLLTMLRFSAFVCDLPKFDRNLVDWDGLTTDNARVVAGLLRLNQEIVCSVLSNRTAISHTIRDVLRYLVEGEQNLMGIPLLQLKSGEVRTFDQSAELIFASYCDDIGQLFGADRVVGPAIPIIGNTLEYLINANLNVRKLNLTGIKYLLEQCHDAITPAGRKIVPNFTESNRHWYKSVLTFLNKLDCVKWSDVASLPLIPTIHGGAVVSLEYAKKPEVLRGSLMRQWNCPINPVDGLGVIIIDDIDLPFITSELPHMDELSALLHALKSTPHPLSDLNHHIGTKKWKELSQWIISRITESSVARLSYEDIYTLTLLPIFSGTRGQDPWSYTAAHNLHMLPRNVTTVNLRAVLQYLPSTLFALHSVGLRTILNSCVLQNRSLELTSERFINLLSIPSEITASDDDNYLTLLRLFVTLHPEVYHGRLIPDEHRQVQVPGTLYDHRVQLFTRVLEGHPELFIHPRFRDGAMMGAFITLGVRRSVGSSELLACATTLDQDARNDVDVTQRARQFWRHFNSGVASSITQQLAFAQLSHLRFIPAHPERHSQDDLARFANGLPSVISPDQAVLRQHSSIAWTQRATIADEPSAILIAIMPMLGVPTIGEVVAHLLVLATEIAPQHSPNMHLLADIKATYACLNSNIQNARILLQNYQDTFLWLNVDDPRSRHETWVWRSSKQLVFDMSFDDEGDEFYDAKDFLY